MNRLVTAFFKITIITLFVLVVSGCTNNKNEIRPSSSLACKPIKQTSTTQTSDGVLTESTVYQYNPAGNIEQIEYKSARTDQKGKSFGVCQTLVFGYDANGYLINQKKQTNTSV